MAETDTTAPKILRPRARPKNIKPVVVDTDDDDNNNDVSKEAESVSIPDDDDDSVAVTATVLSDDQGNITLDSTTRDVAKTVYNFSSDDINSFESQGGSNVLDGYRKAIEKVLGGSVSMNIPLNLRTGRIDPNKTFSISYKRSFAEGGKTGVDTEMEEILSETKDPVSGNTAPLGATTAEVRDDIPIMASPNEFMINAATRRYYGTEFFENLQEAAKQGFERIKDGQESFFRDDELEVEQEAQKLQEGGEVEDKNSLDEAKKKVEETRPGYGGTGPIFTGFTFEIYVDPATGQEMQIVFFNGRPLSRIPIGYVLKGSAVKEGATAPTAPVDDDDDDDGTAPPPVKTFHNTPNVSTWEIDFYKNYSNYIEKFRPKNPGQLSTAEKVLFSGVGGLLGFDTISRIFGGESLVTQEKLRRQQQAEGVIENAKAKLAGGGLSEEDTGIYNSAITQARRVLTDLGKTVLDDTLKPGSGSVKPENNQDDDDDDNDRGPIYTPEDFKRDNPEFKPPPSPFRPPTIPKPNVN